MLEKGKQIPDGDVGHFISSRKILTKLLWSHYSNLSR